MKLCSWMTLKACHILQGSKAAAISDRLEFDPTLQASQRGTTALLVALINVPREASIHNHEEELKPLKEEPAYAGAQHGHSAWISTA